uniref:AAA domain-containing protein n=1 Tax=Rhabditophanes sp. KR3021 TaxID=114890 RepID=A0AC35UC93_9BILA
MGDAPWVEKYRPIKLCDTIGNQGIIERLEFFAANGNIPNLLLSGPPGCGKTTSVWAMAKEMLGQHHKKGILELNASDDRGIEAVRNKIKDFCQAKTTFPSKNMTKIVILDEADSMTEAAQQAMRRIMEEYSDTTRFAFACNNSEKIIEPLQSRCGILRFSRISDLEMQKRLLQVCKSENVEHDEKGLMQLVNLAEGDMRQALNNLQCTVAAYQIVTAENVLKVCDEPHPTQIIAILTNAFEQKFEAAVACIDHLWTCGYSTTDILSNLSKQIKSIRLPEIIRIEFMREIGIAHARALMGQGSKVQLLSLVSTLVLKRERLQVEYKGTSCEAELAAMSNKA